MSVKILVDARKLGDGGIGVYIENLVDGLLILQDKNLIDLKLSLLVSEAFFESDNRSAFSTHYRTHGVGALLFDARLRWFGRVEFIREPSPKYSLREYFLLPLRQRRILSEHDLFHSPHYTLPFFLGMPSVVTIHDVIHLSHPEKFYHRPVARSMIRSALRRANAVITVSEYSARHIQNISRGLSSRVFVVPNALRPSLKRRPAEEVSEYLRREFITRNYCLYVGNERPHKGFRELLSAWKELAQSCSLEQCPDLIVVGKKFALSRDLVNEMQLDGHVRFFGEINLERLALFYSGASAVLLPSKAEGFGLPALEGMGVGTPVICANIPSLKEVCGDAAFYVDKGRGESFAQAICKVLSEPEAAKEKVRLGLLRAQEFDVEHCARKTWRIYEKVLGMPATMGEEPVAVDNKKLQA